MYAPSREGGQWPGGEKGEGVKRVECFFALDIGEFDVHTICLQTIQAVPTLPVCLWPDSGSEGDRAQVLDMMVANCAWCYQCRQGYIGSAECNRLEKVQVNICLT